MQHKQREDLCGCLHALLLVEPFLCDKRERTVRNVGRKARKSERRENVRRKTHHARAVRYAEPHPAASCTCSEEVIDQPDGNICRSLIGQGRGTDGGAYGRKSLGSSVFVSLMSGMATLRALSRSSRSCAAVDSQAISQEQI